MSDLLEKDQFISLNIQKENWYYKYKIFKVKKEIKKYLDSENLLSVNCLDIGSGNGIISFGIGNKINNTTLNWTLVDSNYKKKDLNIDYRKSKKIDPNQTYEIIIGCDVLEHVEDETKFLGSIYDCMNEDSILILTLPAMEILWSDHDIFLKHFRRYNFQTIRNAAKKYFNILNFEYTYKLLFPVAFCLRKIKKILISTSSDNVKAYKKETTNTFLLLDKIFFILLQIEEFLSNKFKKLNLIPGVSLIISLKKK